MKFARLLQRLIQPKLDRGGWIKMRHAYPAPLAMIGALRSVSGNAAPRLAADTRILLVGAGTAALSCAEALKAGGCANVTIVSPDTLFGGKCVNLGCMPSEFVLANRHMPQEALRSGLAAFVESLRNDAARAFESIGYSMLTARAAAVEGSELLLEDGRRLPFDRLILATGSDYPLPRQIMPDHPLLIDLETFWRLAPGGRIAIYAENNPAALALGSVAKALGLDPVVLMAGTDALGGAPSYRYFLRQLGASGVQIRQKVRLLGLESDRITFEKGNKRDVIVVDHVLVASRPVPRVLPIDGTRPSLFNLDHARCALPERPDIAFIGDSSGLFTATEADAQARLLVSSWLTGAPAGLERLAALPMTIDAPASLAMLGPLWALAAKDWRELDFRALGWSKVQTREGKLWYLFDERTRRVDALHICHPAAKELIALAGVLIGRPIDDASWHLGAPHPTGAEIFRLLARAQSGSAALVPASATQSVRLLLPALDELSPGGPLPEWLTTAEAADVVIAADPRRAAAQIYALAMLKLSADETRGPTTLHHDPALRSYSAETTTTSVIVSY